MNRYIAGSCQQWPFAKRNRFNCQLIFNCSVGTYLVRLVSHRIAYLPNNLFTKHIFIMTAFNNKVLVE